MPSRNRGRKKVELRDLMRATPSLEELSALRDQLIDDHSPAIVRAIIGQSLIENDLDDLLRDHFHRSDDRTWAMLTQDNGPISAFHSKAVAAYAFGICDDAIFDAINRVRKIRNYFAHSKVPSSFDQQAIREEFRKLAAPDHKKKGLCRLFDLVRIYGDETSASLNPETGYVLLCLTVSNELTRRKRSRLNARKSRLLKRYQNRRGQLLSELTGDRSAHQEGF